MTLMNTPTKVMVEKVSEHRYSLTRRLLGSLNTNQSHVLVTRSAIDRKKLEVHMESPGTF